MFFQLTSSTKLLYGKGGKEFQTLITFCDIGRIAMFTAKGKQGRSIVFSKGTDGARVNFDLPIDSTSTWVSALCSLMHWQLRFPIYDYLEIRRLGFGLDGLVIGIGLEGSLRLGFEIWVI